MLIAPEFAAEEEPAARRVRFWARLGQEQIAACLISELGFEPGLLYLHLLAQPVGEGEAETLEYADVPQLAEALRSDETSAFLCARIEEVWQQTSRLQQVLRAVPYTEFYAGGFISEPLADEELTKDLVQFAWHHPSFTPELVHLFLRVLGEENARQQLEEILHAHAKRELRRIVEASWLPQTLLGEGESRAELVRQLGQLEEKGLIIQEANLSPGVVRIRLLAHREPPVKRKKPR